MLVQRSFLSVRTAERFRVIHFNFEKRMLWGILSVYSYTIRGINQTKPTLRVEVVQSAEEKAPGRP